jgi:hypothetical protein
MKRTEKRVFAPYETADNCISIAFSPTKNDALIKEQNSFSVTDDDMFMGLEPRAEIGIDGEFIKKVVGEEVDNLSLAIVIRNHESKFYETIASYSFKDIPKQKIINFKNLYDKPLKFYSGLSILFVLFLNKDVERVPQKPYRYGSVVAQREIKISRDISLFHFPIVPKNPSDFQALGLPNTTVWYVKFLSTNVDAPVDSVIEVWVNTDTRSKLDALMSSSRAGYVLAAEMAAEILAVISQKVFEIATSESEEDASLQANLERKFKEAFATSFDDLKKISAEDDSAQKYRALCHKISGLTNSIKTYG